jgi:F-type H+-transporting ATPase subunit gamma
MRLAEIETHIASISELFDIVGAMRSLASMRMQEAYRTLPCIRRYAETMAAAIGSALSLMPEPRSERSAPRRRALIVCAAEHGFVGGYTAHVLDAAEHALNLEESPELFVLGSRGVILARERNLNVAWSNPMATRPEGVPEVVRRLTAELYRSIARGHITCVEVIFLRYRQGATVTIEHRQLLPVNFASFAAKRSRLPPLHNLAPDLLLKKLVADYVFAVLTEAAVEALASENTARFAAMSGAHDNVSKKLEELRQDAREARQNEITAELLDLATGAEAARGAEPERELGSTARRF